MSIEVIITDDHPLVVSGLQNMLRPYSHIRVMASYSSGEALLTALQVQQPDVILLDILLPGKKGTEIAALITSMHPSIKILAISSLDAPTYVKSMMRSGCKGYLLKSVDQPTLLQAIEAIHQGEEFIQPQLKEQMLQNMLQYRKQPPDKLPTLTRREKEVLELIIKEYSSQQIADQLYISLRTVENHRFNLKQKLEAKNSAGLIKIALQLGLVDGQQ